MNQAPGIDPQLAPQQPEKLEHIQDYCPGGYHPLHLGDQIHKGRYTIINKLGWGATSTVWLATDANCDNICVALSISRADQADHYRKDLMEKLKYIRSGDDHHPGKASILVPLDSFSLDGPNGEHFCLVMRFEGQTISRATNRAQGLSTRPLPLQRAKQAVLELAQGIDYMHRLGMAHGDLHPANIFLGIPDKGDWTLDQVNSVCGAPKTKSTRPLSNHAKNLSIPNYLVADAMTHEVDPEFFPGPIKIADFGLAFFASDTEPTMASGGPYIVPEFNAPGHCTLAADIWMFACAIYQFISGFDLMGVIDDSPLKMTTSFMETLGAPPAYLFESWKRFIGLEALKVMQEPSKPLQVKIWNIRDGNVELGMKERKDEFSIEDIEMLTRLLEFMLHLEPEERPTISEVLKHPVMEYFKD